MVAREMPTDVFGGVRSETVLFEEDRSDAAANVRRGTLVLEAPSGHRLHRHKADGIRHTKSEHFPIDDEHPLARPGVAIDRSADEKAADRHFGPGPHDGAAAGPGDCLKAVLGREPRVAELAEACEP